MRKKIISLIVTIGLATTMSMQVMADPLSDQLKSQKNQLEQQNKAYKQAQNNVQDIENSIEKLDFDIEKIYSEVDKTEVKIGNTEKQIEKTTKDIQVAQENIKEEEDLFNKRMRTMYMNGVDSYLEILLDSTGVEDLMSRVDNIKKIVEYDNKVIEKLNNEKIKIEDQKTALETEKTKLVALKSQNEKKIVSLKVKKEAQHELIVEANKQEQLYSGKITDAQATVNATMKEIQKIRASVSKYSPSRGSASISSNAIVAYASNFLGTPYVWAANGPSSFDCSGFTVYVFRHFGVSLTRTTYTQINQGSYVSRGDLQPGDLVFFGSGTPHHVGIYVGNNSYIHAPQTGDVVKISALTRSDYLSARRVR
ncbi:NlpC/P60 family protein [Clostridium sp.]|uniref:C40 family peptidase n=1 Tax=Clostridium sp. TaxID=1506 RepID=UPI003D6D4000